MRFNKLIGVGGGFPTGRYIGPYGCAVPVHETLGLSLRFIIGGGRDNVDERNTPDSSRARFIAASADVSASGGLFC